MTFGGGVTHVGREVFRYVETVVVVDLHCRHERYAEKRDREGRCEHGARPPHGDGADAPPTPDVRLALGVQQSKATRDHHDCRRGRQCSGDYHYQPDCRGYAQCLEIRQTCEMQAQGRAGDGESRTHDDVRRAAEHRVVGRLSVFAGSTCLLVAADQEDRVIGSGRDRKRGQHRDHERREAEDAHIAQQRDNTSCRAHFESDHDQYEQHRDDRPVGDEQHDHDDHAGDAHHEQHALVGCLVHIGGQRR